jgi:hypothetical protein
MIVSIKILWAALSSEQAKKAWVATAISGLVGMAILDHVYKLHGEGMQAVKELEKHSAEARGKIEKTADERFAVLIDKLNTIGASVVETEKRVWAISRELKGAHAELRPDNGPRRGPARHAHKTLIEGDRNL